MKMAKKSEVARSVEDFSLGIFVLGVTLSVVALALVANDVKFGAGLMLLGGMMIGKAY